MKRFFLLVAWCVTLAFHASELWAADAPPPGAVENQASAPAAGSDAEKQKIATAAAAAATAAATREVRPPDLLEHLVDVVLGLFNIHTSGNSVTHYVISALLLIIGLLARRIVTHLIFPALRKLASKTETTLDDKLFPALEGP